VAITGGVTFVALLAVALVFSIYFGLPRAWGFLVAAILTLGFVVEDVMRWRSVRLDLWQVSEGQLIHDGPDGRAQIPLSEIESAKLQFGSRVVIRMRSGQRMVIRYLPHAGSTASQIQAAIGPPRP